MAKQTSITVDGIPIIYAVTNTGYVTACRFSFVTQNISPNLKLHTVTKKVQEDDMLDKFQQLSNDKNKLELYLKSLIYKKR